MFRIMYVHVPTSMIAQSAYIVMGVAGFMLLVWRMKLADMVLATVVPFGMSMTALSLFTGAVWGRPSWGTWWEWDARTTSMLVLLFLYFGLYALRQAIPRQETAGRACAVLALLGMINIPIIKYSVDWWLSLHQSRALLPGSGEQQDLFSGLPPKLFLPTAVVRVGTTYP